MSAIDQVVSRAARRAHGERRPDRPPLRLAVVTCMDGRVDPAAVLDLHPGEAYVLRNAGGLGSPETLAALRFSEDVLGTREVMVLMHTDCAALKSMLGVRHAGVDDVLPVAADQVARLRAEWAIPHGDAIRGFVLDLRDGRLHEAKPLFAIPPPEPAAVDESRWCPRCGRLVMDRGTFARWRYGPYCGPICRAGGPSTKRSPSW